MSITEPANTEVVTATKGRHAIAAASFGTFVEYYDFAIYGYVATYLAAAFFPTGSSLASLLLTFGAFAISFVARPLGAVIFAPLGDRYGRRPVLAAVILLMTLATAGIGMLPTYAQVGVTAPVLLTLLRLLQGLSAGGEYGGATSMIAEYAPEGRRGFYVGFVSLMVGSALLLGSLLSLGLSRALGPDAMSAWGWRVPLLAALPLGLVGLYVRFRLEETPQFRQLKVRGQVQKSPLMTTLRRDHRAVVLGLGIAATNSCLMALYFIYLPSALVEFGAFEPEQAKVVTIVGLVAYCAAILPLARRGDRVGRPSQVIGSSAALVVLVYPTFLLINTGNLLVAVVVMALVAPIIAANVTAVTPLLTEMFTTDTRMTGLSMGWQLATAVFAGPTPIIAALLASKGGASTPALLGACVALLTLLSALSISRRTRSTTDPATLR